MKMLTLLSYLLGLFLLAVVAATILSAYIIWQNQLPLNDSPGTIIRLQTYLSTHVASTSEDSPFPELKPLRFKPGTEKPAAIIKRAITVLGWQLIEEDEDGSTLHAVITTEKMKYKDDLKIMISEQEDGQSVVNLRSESRKGTADFGTNARHILDLKQALGKAIE